MATDVTTFSAMARAEFMNGKMAADERPMPAAHEMFTSTIPSTTKVETHTYMSNLPRLAEFKGYSPGVRLVDKVYNIANKEYRIGPVQVRKTDLDDDQIGGYLKSINGIPTRGQKDIGHKILAHLAAGASTACFDGTNFFADSHTFGSGDNLDTFDGAANDGATHTIIAMITENPSIKPVIFQDRESLSSLMTDADTPQAMKLKEFEYWADCRFGLGYGYWWDAIKLTITDTPTVAEMYTIIEQLINRFRGFTLPKGKDTDDALYVHEGWDPAPSNFVLACNLKLGVTLRRALAITQYVSSGGNVDNVYKDCATVVPSSALGA
jgi:phage major head subunit gpT-like protein